MSNRNVRKLYGSNTLPPPEDLSEDDYEPLYATTSSQSNYQLLELSSHSESDHESNEVEDKKFEDQSVEPEMFLKKKKKKKKLRKFNEACASTSKEYAELDEIDQSILEVNAILGAPSQAPVHEVKATCDPTKELLAVQQKHLNVANELRKLFGPEDAAEDRRRRPNIRTRALKKAHIVPTGEFASNTQNRGLSMSVQRREDGNTYFVYDHSLEYQKRHRSFLRIVVTIPNRLMLPLEEAQMNMQVEILLEIADSLFRAEEYTTANKMIEMILDFMQRAAHPSFNLTDRSARLEYRFVENRAFHLAVLKYLYLLSNKACHRTALELAKLLMNLDPSDPLAVISIIDTLALRAREHKWLIDAVEHWAKSRNADALYNISYSNAMAHFHVATKNKEDLTTANMLLQSAMMRFPSVVAKILEYASTSTNTQLQSHTLFSTFAEETTRKNLKKVIGLYAKLSSQKWREPPVMDWLVKNAMELADKYDKNSEIKARIEELSVERLYMFQSWPREVVRHLSAISSMSKLLVDGDMPDVPQMLSSNPWPPENGIDRYNYNNRFRVIRPVPNNSTMYGLFASIIPNSFGEAEREAAARIGLDLDAIGDNLRVVPGVQAEFVGMMDPFTGQIDPPEGQMDPFGGQMDPFGGQMDPFAGQMDPLAGQMVPFAGQMVPFGGPMDPVAGRMDPFAGQMDPFAGQMDPFAGQMDPFAVVIPEQGAVADAPEDAAHPQNPVQVQGYHDLSVAMGNALRDMLQLYPGLNLDNPPPQPNNQDDEQPGN